MDENRDHFALQKLHITVILWALLVIMGFSYGAFVFFRDLALEKLLKSSAVILLLGGYFFVTLWKDLSINRSVSSGMLYPDLGLANHISIFRGVLSIALAGFIFAPFTGSRLELAPGILFLNISVLDFADGAAARLTGRTTRLGERLDMRLDGAGVLFGSIILVVAGRAPVFFVAAGMLRYLYLFGQWLLQRIGKPVHSLPPNPYRRALAGMMMGFISVTLFPIFSSVVTGVAAILFLIPFLIGFGQDWLYTSGILSPEQGIKRPVGLLYDLFLLIIRIAAGCFLIFSPVFLTYYSTFFGFMFSLIIIMGLLPRVIALGIIVYAGNLLSIHASDPMMWTAFVLACASFFLGGGHLALWSPEEWLIFHRVGDEA